MKAGHWYESKNPNTRVFAVVLSHSNVYLSQEAIRLFGGPWMEEKEPSVKVLCLHASLSVLSATGEGDIPARSQLNISTVNLV